MWVVPTKLQFQNIRPGMVSSTPVATVPHPDLGIVSPQQFPQLCHERLVSILITHRALTFRTLPPRGVLPSSTNRRIRINWPSDRAACIAATYDAAYASSRSILSTRQPTPGVLT